jgi:GntR family phosphonate transport system transcriptional regulator
MAKTPLWKSIAITLTADIAEGRYSTGDQLPTEASLAAKFSGNRHTIRRALSEMSDQGLIYSRRGAGVFVAAKPTDYPIGKRVRYHQNIRASGQSPAKKILAIETRAADTREAEALGLAPGAQVHGYTGLSVADATPMALLQSSFPAERVPRLPDHLRHGGSVTEALKLCGIEDHIRLSTRITAKLANAAQATVLHVAEGSPILRTESVSTDGSGTPIEFGRTWFAGDRVTLTFADSET